MAIGPKYYMSLPDLYEDEVAEMKTILKSIPDHEALDILEQKIGGDDYESKALKKIKYSLHGMSNMCSDYEDRLNSAYEVIDKLKSSDKKPIRQ